MLISRSICGLLVMASVVSLCGCSGLGQFNRHDYSSLTADPFLDTESEFTANDGGAGTSGFARLDDSRGIAPSGNPTRSPGPSLSDFVNRGPGGFAEGVRAAPHVMTAADAEAESAGHQAAAAADSASADFLAWANAQKNEIQQVSGEVRESVQKTDSGVRYAVADFQDTAFDFYEEEQAEPLIQNQRSEPAALLERVGEESPFAAIERNHQRMQMERPQPSQRFVPASPPQRRSAAALTQPAESSKRFVEDSGWRPAHFDFP